MIGLTRFRRETVRPSRKFAARGVNRTRNGSRRLQLEPLEARVVLSAPQPAFDVAFDAADTPVRLNIFVDSDPVALPADIGVNGDGSKASVSTSDTSGSLDIAAGTTPTLGDFFTIWRTDAGLAGNNPSATFGQDELLGNMTDATSTVQMFVNGTLSTEFDQYALQPGDAIVLVYGANPVVSLNTNFGPLVFELFEQQTPGTVDNFLNYVNDGDYINSFFHRSVNNFIIQVGGFSTTSTTFTDTSQFSDVPTDPEITNEPGISNVRGTVAMAKIGGNPNSATNQFFVNLNDNSANLDAQNGGFTVFAQVLDMSIADRIAAVPVLSGNPDPYSQLPVSDSGELVVIQSVVGNGRLTGLKYADLNENGVQDAGEPGIGGVTVFIDANASGQLDVGELSTVTDTDGRFLLEVEPGSYALRAEVTDGETATGPLSPDSYAVTVEIGRTEEDLDFGETRTPDQGGDPSDSNTISGLVYIDANNDGVRDASEVGVPGSQITLSGTVDGGEAVSRSVLTLGNGAYTFDELPAGVYQLVQTQPQSLVDGIDSTGVDGAVAGDDQITNLVVSGDQEFGENNFGERGLKAAYISPAWFFASASSPDAVFREMVAQGESLAGNDSLAEAIRDGATEVPPDQTPPDDVNTPPVAVADDYTVNTNSTLDVPATGVLANDSDADGDPLTATVVDAPANGSLTLNANGSFTYTPGAQFVGSDSFTYTVSDGEATSNIATVTLLVEGNVFTVTEDSGAGTSVGTLRVDGLTGPLMFEIDAPSLPDELSLVLDDHFSGDPAASLVLIEYVDFQCAACAAFHPIVQDLETQFEDDLLVVQRYFPLITTHDNALPAAWAAEAAGRQDKFDEMGGLLYQNQSQWKDESDPNTFFVDYATTLGLDLGQFASDMADPAVDARVQRDLQAGESLGVQGTPTFFLNGDKLDLSGTSNELMSILNSVLNDADNPFTVDRTTGEILVTGFTNLNFESTPKHELTVNVTDVDGNREQLDVVINVVDTPERPIAIEDAYEVDQEGALNVDAAGVLVNDTDPDSDSLEAILGTSTANGTLNLASDGSFSYAPDSGFTGTDSFTYQASDGTLSSSPATVTITVRDVNIAPVAVADAYEVDEDGVLTVNVTNGVLANDSDVDDDDLSAELLDQPSNGTVDLKPDGSFTYTPDDNFVGTDTFTYQASDGTLVSNAVTVTLTVVDVNQSPVAREDQYDVRAGQPLTVGAAEGLLNNDTDVDGGPLPALQVERLSSPLRGSVSVDLDGGFTYTPDAGFVGTDTFTYRASDGQKKSEETTVTLKVAADQVLTVVAGTADGTSVGQVAVEGSPTAPLLYDILDSDLPDALQLVADDHLTGDPAAEAVWVQYVDFQHVAAQSLHQEVRKLEQTFAGDLLVVTRYFPATGLNSNALKAAQAVEAAGRQGKFDAMVDHLFAVEHWNNAEEWRTATDPWPLFAQYAAEIGLGDLDAAAQFLADYNASATLDRIQRDVDTAKALGVTGTPAFYLNGQSVTAPWTFDALKNRVEEQLNAVSDPLTIDRRTGEIQVAKSDALDPAVNPVVILPVSVSDANGLFDTVYVQVNVVDSSTPAIAGDSTAATDAAFAGEQDWRRP